MQKALLYLAFLLPLLLKGGWKEGAIAGLLLLLSAYFLAQEKNEVAKRLRQPLNISLLTLSALLIISLLWTSATYPMSLALALTPLYLALWNALSSNLGMMEGRILLLAGSGVVAAVAIIATFAEVRPWAIQLGGAWRAAGTVEYPLALLGIMFAALPHSLLIFGKEKGLTKILVGGLLLIILGAILLTGERLAFLGVFIFLLGSFVFANQFHVSKKMILSLCIMTAPLLALALFMLQPEWNSEPASGFLSGRESGWIQAVHLIIEQPWGWGVGSWDIVSGQKELFPHSLPLQVGFEGGLLALFVACAVFFFWLREALPAYKFLLAPIIVGSLLFLFDWSWVLPSVGASILLSTNLAARDKKQ